MSHKMLVKLHSINDALCAWSLSQIFYLNVDIDWDSPCNMQFVIYNISFCMLANFSWIFVVCWLKKINFFKKLFQEHYQNAEQFES